METLRVVTLNLWNKSGPWSERKALVCAELARLRADIVGFQELLRLDPASVASEGDSSRLLGETTASVCDVGAPWTWTPESDQLTEVARGLEASGGGAHYLAFVEAKSFGGGLLMGNGLMSRFPLREVRGYRLPGQESGESRSVLYALIDTPAGELPVFVTHLNWKWHHGSVRLRQVRALVDQIEALHPRTEAPPPNQLPPVLLGDFNAEPDSDEIRFLRGLHTVDGASVHFADSWAWAGDGGTGYTFDRANAFAARSNEPPRRIDYVFVRGPDAWLRGEPLRAEVAFKEPSAGPDGAPIWPSDHYGLVVDLAARPRGSAQ